MPDLMELPFNSLDDFATTYYTGSYTIIQNLVRKQQVMEFTIHNGGLESRSSHHQDRYRGRDPHGAESGRDRPGPWLGIRSD
ncbi:hypothetical protein GCM10023157_34500 [Gluconacetobacter asukensis]